jgi:Cof subfamily protein (haloacid dehalogenase superfamily)
MMKFEDYIKSKSPNMAVFDIDGTILSEEGALLPQVCQSICRLAKYDITAIIATGRPWYTTESIWRELGLRSPAICLDGSVVYDPMENRVIRAFSFPRDWYDRILERFSKDFHIITETSTEVWTTNKISALITHLTFKRPRKSINIGQLPSTGTEILRLHIVPSSHNKPINDSIINFIRDTMDNSARIYLENPRWLVVCCSQTCKSEALAWLCKDLGHSIDRAIAFGDGSNDIGLFKSVGFAIAVKNAYPALKELAHTVSEAAYGDGVVNMIETWIEILEAM